LRFINLSENKLSNVNLSPLNQCGGLEELLLDKNQMIEVELFGQTRVKRIDLKKNLLTRVDFAPLIHCENLVHLTLSDNKLEELDLEPLGSCKNLKSLDLQNNRLRSLDLSPLQDLKNFGVIYLSNNLLEAVNLSPLGGCVGLKTISLNDNKLAEIDLSPLDSHEPPENPQHLLLQHVDARESRRSARQSNSHGVQGISLQNNCIEKVVLCSSPTLQGINLSSNKLRSIDLRPLEGCTNLNAILLTNNPLEDIEFGQLGPEERLKVKLDPDIKV
jgi:Leucine-rich repeat (LRR) protein